MNKGCLGIPFSLAREKCPPRPPSTATCAPSSPHCTANEKGTPERPFVYCVQAMSEQIGLHLQRHTKAFGNIGLDTLRQVQQLQAGSHTIVH